MTEVRLWLYMLLIQCLVLNVTSHRHYRHSMTSRSALPISKSGWRPVVGSGGLLYGSLGTAPLHAPHKFPIHEYYPSTGRPIVTRDVNKLTSIAQSYRPTTLRSATLPVNQIANQPISSYLNPFVLPNNALTQYKVIQNYPIDNVYQQNIQNPYFTRNVYQKNSSNQKQQFSTNVNKLQQLTNIQPVQFSQYSTPGSHHIFSNAIHTFVRPNPQNRPNGGGTEIYKPEVYKVPDHSALSQAVSQQVKTAQQQTQPYFQYSLQDLAGLQQLPPSILGTFGSFGVQSVKGRDPVYQSTKTTNKPQQATKQSVLNSYNYSHNLKSTPLYTITTPKLQTHNQIHYQQYNEVPHVPTPAKKPSSPKDTKAGQNTGGFKPSPQDPFIKTNLKQDVNKVTTYNPPITTNSNQYYINYSFATQNSNQHNANVNYNNNNNKQIHDSVGLTQQVSHQFVNPPNAVKYADDSVNPAQYQGSYEVTEKPSDDVITRPSTGTWYQEAYDFNQKVTEPAILTQENFNSILSKPVHVSESPEEYAIVTEPEKPYDNGLNYDNQFESQNRRPLGDDFEPIEKNKLKDYYYASNGRRTKKPEKVEQDVTTDIIVTSETPIESLPTLSPEQHFKRPSAETSDKEKTRKRNKIRRRRPIHSRNRNDTSTTTTTEATQTTDEIHTIRPRTRPQKQRTEAPSTTPTVTTDFTTSALPTVSPTAPTPMKKKVSHQRVMTTLGRTETTTQHIRESEHSKESPIMKISTRPHSTRQNYEYRNSEVPDYTHKQDEKDTPTSDTSIYLRDTVKKEAEFSFHRDVRPVEVTTESAKETSEIEATTLRTESSNIGKIPKINKYSRPKFSVKDYRNRLSSTTSSTEKTTEAYKQRFPQRKSPYSEINTEIETTTERRRFTPKEPRHKNNRTNEQETHSRQSSRIKQVKEEPETTTQRISSRIRNGQRRPKPTDETIETSSTTVGKRPLRKKIKDSETGESVQDITINDSKSSHEHKNEITSERTRSESAIMKIADKKHQDHIERLFEHSKRVSDLTLAASKDYNTPGMFKAVPSNSRRVPNYFTIATDDPILPIEAFFPQLNQKKEP